MDFIIEIINKKKDDYMDKIIKTVYWHDKTNELKYEIFFCFYL